MNCDTSARLGVDKEWNVLLISPRSSSHGRGYGGDYAYTDILLSDPPPGVHFRHYHDLLESGEIRRLKWLYRLAPRLVKAGLLPPDMWAEYLASEWVPDILHIHAFSAVAKFGRIAGPVPIVLSTSTGSSSDLSLYLGWSKTRLRLYRSIKRIFLQLIDAHDTSLRPEKASSVVVWSQFAQDLHLSEGFVDPDLIRVINPGLPWKGNHPPRPERANGVTFAFVGLDFERKNGQMLLEAFREVRSKAINARLLMVSSSLNGDCLEVPGVQCFAPMPRHDLFDRIYQRADVLVLPSRAEGFGLAVLEAMSFGIPVIGINSWAMPEVISHGENGFLVPSESRAALTSTMMQVALEPSILTLMRNRVRETFKSRFSVEVHNRRLRAVYDNALQNGVRRPAPVSLSA